MVPACTDKSESAWSNYGGKLLESNTTGGLTISDISMKDTVSNGSERSIYIENLPMSFKEVAWICNVVMLSHVTNSGSGAYIIRVTTSFSASV